MAARAVVIANGFGSYGYGSVKVVNTNVLHTFTVVNKGGQTLQLNGSPRTVVSGTNAADFVVTTQPAATIAAGGRITFVVRFDPSALGTRTATVKIASSDTRANPYTFTLSGTGIN